MGVRLEPSDEYMHELGPESNFNESMYINCFDPSTRMGGWFRMGNRANEGYAEMTTCVYLPDGRTVRAAAFPISIDTAGFQELAASDGRMPIDRSFSTSNGWP